MKTKLLALAFLICPLFLIAESSTSNDTVIISKTKTIISGNTISTTTETDTVINNMPPSEVIADGSTYSFIFQWKKKRRMHPHWTGMGMSFLNYDDANIPNGSLNMGRSHAFSLNLIDYKQTILNTNFMLVSGVGIDWHRYHFNGNAALTKVDNITQFKPAPDGINYKDSKLLAYYFTIPLLIEYQPTRNIHMSAGVVGYFKCYSKSQVKYAPEGGRNIKDDMGRDLNIRPVDLKLRMQAGIDDVAVFATYSPFSMFSDNKGPDLKSYSIGIMVGF